MILYYLQLLWNPTAYEAWRTSHAGATPVALWERLKAPLKALLLALGAYITTTPLTALPSFLPPWVGPLVLALSAFVQKNPDLVAVAAAMTDSQKDATIVRLAARAGAPDAVAVVAAPIAPIAPAAPAALLADVVAMSDADKAALAEQLRPHLAPLELPKHP